jgi:hypothetical protein
MFRRLLTHGRSGAVVLDRRDGHIWAQRRRDGPHRAVRGAVSDIRTGLPRIYRATAPDQRANPFLLAPPCRTPTSPFAGPTPRLGRVQIWLFPLPNLVRRPAALRVRPAGRPALLGSRAYSRDSAGNLVATLAAGAATGASGSLPPMRLRPPRHAGPVPGMWPCGGDSGGQNL